MNSNIAMAPPALRADWLGRAAGRVTALAGWRRHAVAALAGAVGVLAFAPINVTPALLPSFMVLIWLMDGVRTGRSALATGWWFAFGFHVPGLYWIANALLVDAARTAWLLPFAIFLIPAILGIAGALAVWLAWRWAPAGAARIPAFALAWLLTEWLRGHIATGFPWNLTGYAWNAVPTVQQSLSVLGAYGLSAVTVLVMAAPAALAYRGLAGRVVGLGAAVLIVLMAVAGGMRLVASPTTYTDVSMRLVQPSIPQTMKWDPAEQQRNLNLLVQLSLSGERDPAAVVIWPETALPGVLSPEFAVQLAEAGIVPPQGWLLSGVLRRTEDGGLGNSMVAIGPDGRISAAYDKAHLVPFGEYVPFAAYLPLERITGGGEGFAAGPGPRTLAVPGLPEVSPLICYEVIFPAAVVDGSRRPAWLLNVTNDAWYGRSLGPYQHAAIARARAIEEGLPLVRAANNGVSFVSDPLGRVTAELGLDQRDVIDTILPADDKIETLYAALGDWVLLPLFVLLGLLMWAARCLENHEKTVS